MKAEFRHRTFGHAPWGFFRNPSDDLQALLNNGPWDTAGGRGGRDDEILDHMVASTLWRVRWARRLRVGILVRAAIKRRITLWYIALRERIADKFTRIAAIEKIKQESELPAKDITSSRPSST